MVEGQDPRPSARELKDNEVNFEGKGKCSVAIRFGASASKIAQQKGPLPNLLPWQVWEGKEPIWQSPDDGDHLTVVGDKVEGTAHVVVGNLLQAVTDTHPTWTIQKLVAVTLAEVARRNGHLPPPEQDLDTANSEAARAAEAARAMVEAADALASAIANGEFDTVAKRAEKAISTAMEVAEAADAAAFAAAPEEVAAGNDPDSIYRNFFVRVNVGGTAGPENWIAFSIDMCVHGNC